MRSGHGYFHEYVKHMQKEYARGAVHENRAAWARCRRSRLDYRGLGP
jgi:hypothetical protein